MTTSEYAQKLVAFIEARPAHIDLDDLLAEVIVHVKALGMEDGRKRIHSKLNAHSRGRETTKKTATNLSKTRR